MPSHTSVSYFTHTGKLVRWETLRMRQDSIICFKNVHSDGRYECTAYAVNVFEIGITLPGRSDGNLPVATPCRLQLCAVLWTVANK
jgi:hypothetical protein